MRNKSLYIVLEGIVGTGKSTQAKKIHEWLKKKYPKRKILLTREPGGTEIAENIRKAVQGTKYDEEMHPICEAYLYAASRAQTLNTIVKDTLNDNGIVIADRSFLTSTAWQGEARGLGISKIIKINKTATEGCIPNIVIYLNMNIKEGMSRTFDKDGDKFEKMDISFFEKAEKGYKKIQKKKGCFDKWINIDAKGTREEVFERIKKELEKTIASV